MSSIVATRRRWVAPAEFTLIRSAKIWFFWTQTVTDTGQSDLHLLSHCRKGKIPTLDTLGGIRDAADSSIGACLLRELQEEVLEMPTGWQPCIDAAIAQYPDGHNTYDSVRRRIQESHHTTVWFVHISSKDDLPIMAPRFYKEEGVVGSVEWRPAMDIISNLNRFVFHQSLVLILHRAYRWYNVNPGQSERPAEGNVDPHRAQQRRGLIYICAGTGVMSDSFVRWGFASVVATCETDPFCHQVLEKKHPGATHYLKDVRDVDPSEWVKYRWDPRRPKETAYLLVARPPHPSDVRPRRHRDLKDKESCGMRHLVVLATIMEPPLVVILESWRLLQDEFEGIGYFRIH